MKRARFESFGLYLPNNILSTKELVGRLKNPPIFDLEDITGIETRRVRSENEDSHTMAVEAAKDCLKNSKYKASDLDIIINASITRFRDGMCMVFDPTLGSNVKKVIGAVNARDVDVTNACAGMLTGVYLLSNMIRAGFVKNGMVVSGEYITSIAETATREIKDPIDEQFASLTVGDSGAACILDSAEEKKDGIEFIDFVNCAEFSELCMGLPSLESVGPAMHTKAKEIHDVNIERIPATIEKVFSKHGKVFKSSDYDFTIIHQTSVRAIQKVCRVCKKRFGFDMPQELYTVQDYGNTSTTTHFVVLYNNIKKGVIKPGSRLLLISNASGIVIGCTSAVIGDIRIN